MVLTAPTRQASGSKLSSRGITACLCGMVTFAPRTCSFSRICVITPASSALLSSRGRYRQSMPATRKAAFCIDGERLPITGLPSSQTSDGIDDLAHVVKELGIGDGYRVRVSDRGGPRGNQAGDGKRHHDPMIPARIDRGTLQVGWTLDADPGGPRSEERRVGKESRGR